MKIRANQNNSLEATTLHPTSANFSFPVSTRSFASEHTGTECLITGWRFKISDVWKGAAELKSYFLAATVIPTCQEPILWLSKSLTE